MALQEIYSPTALKGRHNPPQGEAMGILTGGMGNRLTEETDNHPKPMVKIGGYRSSMMIINDCQFRQKWISY
jgi:hypothetical protein